MQVGKVSLHVSLCVSLCVRSCVQVKGTLLLTVQVGKVLSQSAVTRFEFPLRNSAELSVGVQPQVPACLMCMPYMYALGDKCALLAWLICVPYMYAIYVRTAAGDKCPAAVSVPAVGVCGV